MMIAASPSLFRAWRFWAPSAHPREAESDSFLACAAKTKQRLAAAGTRPCTPSLSYIIVVVSRVLHEILRYSDRENMDNTYLVRNTWFLGRTQIRMICFHNIESNSIRFIKNELFRFQSCCCCCCLHIQPFFLPNDISSTPSVLPDSSS